MTDPTPIPISDDAAVYRYGDLPRDGSYESLTLRFDAGSGAAHVGWRPHKPSLTVFPDAPVVARRRPLDPPEGTDLGNGRIATTVGALRGRRDFDQWEFATTVTSGWLPIDGYLFKLHKDDDHPLVVRKREAR